MPPPASGNPTEPTPPPPVTTPPPASGNPTEPTPPPVTTPPPASGDPTEPTPPPVTTPQPAGGDPSQPTPPVTTPPPAGDPTQPTPPPVVRLHIANPPQIVRSETPHAFKAIADYSDGSSADVSSGVTWNGISATAYISPEGIAFCNAPGASSVSAQLGSFTTSASFVCIMKQVVPPAGFAEHAQQFDGPFPSWLNIQTTFGAKGDGVTDDTQAFQNALNQLVRNPSVLWVPKGTYVISSTLQMTACLQFSIIGEDPRNTVIKWNGTSGGTMLDIEGCEWFRLARLGWNGQNKAGVVIRIASSLQNGEYYPTYDDIEDQQISQAGTGIEVGFAGETSVERVHFDHNTVAGISLENWNALNFNVIDSLFTDCNVGVTNAAPNVSGAGAFNVSNSVFVRSQTTDMMMWNTGPFSERQNLSFGSNAFFIGGAIGAGANIILQANTIINSKTTPIQIGSPGPIMLIDNYFTGLNRSLNILSEVGYNPLGVFSIGNRYSVTKPFTGQIGLMNSIDDVNELSDSSPQVDIPADVYVPPLSGRPIFEVPLGSSSSVIQQLVNRAASSPNGGVVHFPSGRFWIDQTIDIPESSNLTLTGDGPVTTLASANSLTGPLFRVSGSHAKLENMQIYTVSGLATDTGVEIDIEDRPSTTIHCDQCKTNFANTALRVAGIDNALVDIRIGEINAAVMGADVTGGPARQSGNQTIGRLDAFMSSLDFYRVSDGGHFLVEDGWHDGGQGSRQFTLSGSGIVTHQGGTVYTPTSAPSMTASGFSGSLSLLGVSTNSTLALNQSPNAAAFVAGTVQGAGVPILSTDSSAASVTQLSNFSSINNGTPTPVSDLPSSLLGVESMFSQARTEYVTPRLTSSSGATEIDLHRIVVTSDNVGISIQPKSSLQTSVAYSITSLATTALSSESPSSSCANGYVSMSGAWTLQPGNDGFYGLKNGSAFLSNRARDSLDLTDVGLSEKMSDAGQRWNLRPIGDGSFRIINRANGKALTSDSSGCISLSAESDVVSQKWSVDLAENR
jgi:hypothetical protein